MKRYSSFGISPHLPSTSPPHHFLAATHRIKNDPNNQTTARAPRNILCLFELRSCDLKAIATGAGVVEEVLCLVVGHVLELDFVVEGLTAHGWLQKPEGVR